MPICECSGYQEEDHILRADSSILCELIKKWLKCGRDEDSKAAILNQEMDGQTMFGKQIKVNAALPKEGGGGRGGGGYGGGGYGGGHGGGGYGGGGYGGGHGGGGYGGCGYGGGRGGGGNAGGRGSYGGCFALSIPCCVNQKKLVID